jgi:hypothetical protein
MLAKKREDYRLCVSITNGEGRTIKDVLCKVYLPQRVADPVELHFLPTKEQTKELWGIPFQFSIYGEGKDHSRKVNTIVQANIVYKRDLSVTEWGVGISETTFLGKPIDLKITHLFSNSENKPDKEKDSLKGSFWLTPSIMLEPDKQIERSFTGKIDVKTFDRFEFQLEENDVKLCFDYHYKFIKNENNDTISFPELVAEFDIKSKEKTLNELLGPLDDFLLLTSFAERQRCICLGWDSADSYGYTRFFRKDMRIPETQRNHDFNDTLILTEDFPKFIISSYKKFTEFKDKDLLRQAIQRATYQIHEMSQNVFLTLFTGIESLVLLARKEYILSPTKRETFNKDVAKFIKTYLPLTGEKNKDQRKLIYEKIPELNRVAFSSAFKKLCGDYKIDLSDLWPVIDGGKIDNKRQVTLSDIRNRLIHGDILSFEEERSLVWAGLHLRLTLERIILSILEWPVIDSRVSHYEVSDKWIAEQNIFSK